MTSAQGTRADSAWRTRENIVAEARRSIVQYGLQPVTVQDVADRVGISRPGLLKHFGSKEDLVDAVAVVFDAEADQILDSGSDPDETALTLARNVYGYAKLSAVFLSRSMIRGSISSSSGTHHQRLLSVWASDESETAEGGREKVAVWEGLQVMSAYLPEIEPALVLRGRGESGKGMGPHDSNPRPEALELNAVFTDRVGYVSGRRRRQQIVSDATTLFAKNGFGGTTMKEISERVNVAPSTLLHHFASKADLFTEVMRERDLEMVSRRAGAILDPVEELLAVGAEADRDAKAERGLISLYAVLSTEAISLEHPVHNFVRERYVRTVAYFENLFARASLELNLSVNARFESIWLVALWDGLQYQEVLESGFDRGELPRMLDAHIKGVLGVS